jgi:cephalosporin hydroxylase
VIEVDLQAGVVTVRDEPDAGSYSLDSPEGFAVISRIWLRAGWDAKYVYTFTWLGRPIIQLPDDLMRIQEVIFQLRPDVIIETGIAHGGSLVFYASLCKAMGHGRVVGIDIDLREKNRASIESHELFPLITLFDGSSVDDAVVSAVRADLRATDEVVLVLLDSHHTKAHVAAELVAYSSFVSPGSYIVAMDGIMEQVVGAPRTQPDWTWNNPRQAASEFVGAHPDFQAVTPDWLFNESMLSEQQNVTYWPGSWLRRRTVI